MATAWSHDIDRAHDARDVSSLMHLSGLHFGAEDPRAAEALVALAEQERPDVVVACGGLTRRAHADEFAAARRFIDRLAAPHVVVLPGPEDLARWDLPRRLVAPYAAFRAAFGPDLEPRVASPQAWIAGLRTTRRLKARGGGLSRQQIEATAQWLRRAPSNALKVVVLPQPPDALSSGASEALHQWQDAGLNLVLACGAGRPALRAQPGAATEPRAPALWIALAGQALAAARDGGAPAGSVHILRRGFAQAWRLERWETHSAQVALHPSALAGGA